MIVTNVPGPPHPLYFLGAELLEAYPIAPLLENLGLTIGLFSYNGNMFWGLMADYDRVPDLKNLAALIETSFQKLKRAAEELEAHKPVPNALDEKRPNKKKVTKKKATKRKATTNRTIKKERVVTKATKRSSAEEMSKKINSESSSQ